MTGLQISQGQSDSSIAGITKQSTNGWTKMDTEAQGTEANGTIVMATNTFVDSYMNIGDRVVKKFINHIASDGLFTNGIIVNFESFSFESPQ